MDRAASIFMDPFRNPSTNPDKRPSLSRDLVERRLTRRHDVSVAITMQSDSNFYQGLSENVSEGGVFIATHQDIPLGTVLNLTFFVPTADKAIRVAAEVRWRRRARALAM